MGDRVVVDVGAGEDWDALVARAVDEGWRGVASLSGIPGLVGATPIQNVGAYGEEVADTIAGVRVFDRASAAFVDLEPGDCALRLPGEPLQEERAVDRDARALRVRARRGCASCATPSSRARSP